MILRNLAGTNCGFMGFLMGKNQCTTIYNRLLFFQGVLFTMIVRKGELPHASPTLKDLISDS